MRNFHKIHLQGAGGVIGGIAKEALSVAIVNNVDVSFEFNGVIVNLTKRSDYREVAVKALEAVQDCTK